MAWSKLSPIQDWWEKVEDETRGFTVFILEYGWSTIKDEVFLQTPCMTLCYEKRYESTFFSHRWFIKWNLHDYQDRNMKAITSFSLILLQQKTACMYFLQWKSAFCACNFGFSGKGLCWRLCWTLLSSRKRRFTVEINHSFSRNKSLKAKSFYVLTFVHRTNYCCERSLIIRGPWTNFSSHN